MNQERFNGTYNVKKGKVRVFPHSCQKKGHFIEEKVK